MEASPVTGALFVALTLFMAAAAASTLSRADGGRLRVPGIFLVAFLLAPGGLAALGVLDGYDPVPWPLLLIAAVSLVTVVTLLSSFGARLAVRISLAWLVGFQAFRIAVELLLHRLADEGVIPAVMTYEGANFDILTGLSAAVLGLVLVGRALPVWALHAWNAMGLVLLLVIVGIATAATPVFGAFPDGPPNRLPGVFPFVWLPTVLVQLALAGHLLLFRRLRARRYTAPRGEVGRHGMDA